MRTNSLVWTGIAPRSLRAVLALIGLFSATHSPAEQPGSAVTYRSEQCRDVVTAQTPDRRKAPTAETSRRRVGHLPGTSCSVYRQLPAAEVQGR